MKSKDIQIPFVQGQDTSGATKAVSETGKFRRVHNLCIRPGESDSLTVRNAAYAIAPETGTAMDNRRIVNVEDRIHLVTATGIYALADDEQTWVTVSAVRNHDLLSATPIELSSRENRTPEGHAFVRGSNGDELTAIAVLGDIYVQLSRSGVKRQSKALLGNVSPVSELHSYGVYLYDDTVGTFFWLVHGDPQATTVRIRRLTRSSDTWLLHVSLLNARLIDSALTDAGFAVLYYNTATTVTRLAMYSITAGTLLWDVAINAAQIEAKIGAICQTTTSNTVHVWTGQYNADSNRIRGFSVNTSTQVVTVGGTYSSLASEGTTLVGCGAAGAGAGSWAYVAEGEDGRGLLLSTGLSMATLSLTAHTPRIWPQAKLFLPAARTGAPSPSPFIIGNLGTQSGIWSLGSQTTNVVMYSGSRGVYRNVSSQRQRGYTLYVNGDTGKALVRTTDGVELIEWGFSASRAQVAQHAGIPVMALGSPKYWDGARWMPVGFSQTPDATLSLLAGVGGLTPGVYVYGLVWEWIDARQRRHQSPPSLRTLTATAVNDRGVVTVNSWSIPADERLVDASGPTRLAIYRSQVGGTTLNRVGSLEIPVTNYANATHTYTDTSSDAVIADNEILYASGGSNELSSFALDACDSVLGFNDRLMWHSPAFPNSVFYSKSLRDGRIWEFNPALSFRVPDAVNALSTQDTNVYAFSVNNVYGFSPQFANDDGSGAVPVDPTPLSAGIGLTYVSSVVPTPEGIMFRGVRGFYMLPRGGGAPQYIGFPAEGSLLPAVLGAAHNPATSEVVWVTSFGSQQIVVYNYLFRQWFTWELYSTSSETWDAGVVVRAVNGFYYFGGRTSQARTLVRLDSAFQGQDTAILGDPNLAIPVVLETADFSVADIGSRNRVLRAAIEMEGSAGGSVMTVEESHDQGSSYVNPVSFDVTTGEPLVYQVLQRKTTGIRFRIRSTTGSLATRLFGMTITVKPLAKAVTRSSNRKG